MKDFNSLYFFNSLPDDYTSNETFTIIPTKFSIRIIETGFIDNVRLCIVIDNTQIEIPCKHQRRYKKLVFKNIKKAKPLYTHKTNIPKMNFPIFDLFSCEYCFKNPANSAYYFFKYTIGMDYFETEKCYFKVENLFV